jgi:probable phosphoglycerate mutase
MGILQGHTLEEGETLFPPENGEIRVEDEPESPEATKKRAMAWWNETIVGTTASCVLVVSHGDWIRSLVKGLLEDKAISAAPDVQVEEYINTGVSIVEMERGGASGKLLQYGNVDHLRDVVVRARQR